MRLRGVGAWGRGGVGAWGRGGVGAWGRALARAGKIPPHHPAHPRPAAVGIAKARPRLSAPRIQAGPRGHAISKKFHLLHGRKRHDRTLKRIGGHGLIFGLPSERKKY